MYELTHQNEVQTFTERTAAVQAAKELTSAADGRSMVNITDGVETLSYRDGKLVAYTYETRRSDSRFDSNRSENNSNAPAAAPAEAAPAAAAPAEAAPAEAASETTTAPEASEASE